MGMLIMKIPAHMKYRPTRVQAKPPAYPTPVPAIDTDPFRPVCKSVRPYIKSKHPTPNMSTINMRHIVIFMNSTPL